MCSACVSTALPVCDVVRGHFPVFEHQPDVIFLDNASTTQKPKSVIDVIEQFYTRNCSNSGRGVYDSAILAAQSIERARCDVARFINAEIHEVAFTSGATDSLNLASWSWGLTNLNDGDEVLICMQDHGSAVLPWRNLQSTLLKLGKRIELVPFDIHEVGDYDLRSIKRSVSPKTRAIALSHIHHVFGLEMEISEIRGIVGSDVLISLDASQSVSHIPIDSKVLDADLISFSGHKMFAGNGVGVLFAHTRRHGELTAVRVGGQSTTVSSEIPLELRAGFIEKVESGTPNIPSIASLSAAIEFIETIGIDNVERYVSHLTGLLLRQLSELPGIIFAPGPAICGCPGGYGILSFRFEQASSFDVSSALAAERIFVRSGSHCRAGAKPEEDYIRASLHMYNTEHDVRTFANTLRVLIA